MSKATAFSGNTHNSTCLLMLGKHSNELAATDSSPPKVIDTDFLTNRTMALLFILGKSEHTIGQENYCTEWFPGKFL